jgi:hypothetical protein
VTVTPGSTAFVLSVTVPLMAPVVELTVCAYDETGAKVTATTARVLRTVTATSYDFFRSILDR